MRLISKKSVLRILQEEPSYYDTQNAITEIYDKINELPTIEERKTMTHEEAVGFLQESGWLQDHDRQIYEQGKRDGNDEHKTGKWIITKRNGILCGVCHSGFRRMPTLDGKPIFRYCPFCGAEMEGAE